MYCMKIEHSKNQHCWDLKTFKSASVFTFSKVVSGQRYGFFVVAAAAVVWAINAFSATVVCCVPIIIFVAKYCFSASRFFHFYLTRPIQSPLLQQTNKKTNTLNARKFRAANFASKIRAQFCSSGSTTTTTRSSRKPKPSRGNESPRRRRRSWKTSTVFFCFFFCFFLISLGAREKKKDDRAPVSGGYQKWGSLVIGGSLNNDRDSPQKKRNKPDLDIWPQFLFFFFFFFSFLSHFWRARQKKKDDRTNLRQLSENGGNQRFSKISEPCNFLM